MSSVLLFVLLRVCLLDSTLPVFIMALYIRARFVYIYVVLYSVVPTYFMLLVKSGAGGGGG